MVQLVTILVAVMLCALLGVTNMWYGGSSFSEASERAIYTTYGNEAIQIRESMRVYGVEYVVPMKRFHDLGFGPDMRDPKYNFDELVAKGYLKDDSLMKAGWVIDKGVVRKPLENTWSSLSQTDQLTRCKNFNTFSRKDVNAPDIKDGCPVCADARYADYPACWIEGEEVSPQ